MENSPRIEETTMRNNLFNRCIILLLFFALTVIAVAQQKNIALPMMAAASVPLYPPIARIANIDGVVHLKITTDGHNVVRVQIVDGQRLLATAAEENAKTWQFTTHEPTTFTVTYRYKLVSSWKGDSNNPIVELKFPTEVIVSIRRSPGTVDSRAGIRQK